MYGAAGEDADGHISEFINEQQVDAVEATIVPFQRCRFLRGDKFHEQCCGGGKQHAVTAHAHCKTDGAKDGREIARAPYNVGSHCRSQYRNSGGAREWHGRTISRRHVLPRKSEAIASAALS